jgi:hypothetical protein
MRECLSLRFRLQVTRFKTFKGLGKRVLHRLILSGYLAGQHIADGLKHYECPSQKKAVASQLSYTLRWIEIISGRGAAFHVLQQRFPRAVREIFG